MNDCYRPRFHFTPPTGWMNDPNGLVYVEGEYHLFYQHLPRKHWGHAVSPDLVHWTHLPIALYPDDLGEMYSGSAVVDTADSSGLFGGRPGLVIIFTHNNKNKPPLGPQVQSIAYSTDRGRTWSKYARNPVIANPNKPDFRDPKVFWHADTKRWVMLLACYDHVRFYVSSDLKDWTHVSEFGLGYGAHNGPWECPDLFELPVDGDTQHTRWVLQVSVYPRDGRTGLSDQRDMQYFIGDFDGATFTSDYPAATVLWTEYGRDNYAAVSWSNIPATDGRRLWLGWMGNWDYAYETPTSPWQGAMTLPREVQLRRCADEIKLTQIPVDELETLRGRAAHWTDRTVTPAIPFVVHEGGDALEIVAVFQLETATECGVRVRTGEAQQTTIGYDVGQGVLFVDRTQSGETGFSATFPGRHGGPLHPISGNIKMHIFVDRSSVEVFGNDGETVVTSLIFPDTATRDLEIYAIKGDIQLASLDIYHLEAI